MDCQSPRIVPPDFEPIDRPGRFGQSFGPVYLNRKTVTLGFMVDERHENGVGMCHGGAMATFADMQIAAVVKSGLVSTEQHTPTISLSVDYVGPAWLGTWVEAAVTVVKATKNLVFTQAIINADGSIVARSSAIYRVYAGESS